MIFSLISLFANVLTILPLLNEEASELYKDCNIAHVTRCNFL